MLEELKVAVKDQRDKLDREREALLQEKNQFDNLKKEVRDEVLQYKAKVEELEYYKKEQMIKNEKLTQFLKEKSEEHDQLLKDYE